jgi:transcriptional regulator with XRE-family HTH domain
MMTLENGTLKGLKRERCKAGLSQPRLAMLAGVSTQTVWNAENGHTIHTRNLAKLANALGVPVAALLEDER